MTEVVARSSARVLEGVPKQLYITGHWQDAVAGGALAVDDPATEAVLCHVADAGAADALAALAAADGAQEQWAFTSPRRRSDLLRAAYDAVLDNAADLSMLITMEMGKPLGESRAEVQYAADRLRWSSEQALRIDGRWTRAPDGDSQIMVQHRPVGPCVLVTPWNFPLAMGTRKLGPALAAGCTAVIKPARQTPLTMLAFADVLHRVGVPPGVVNVIVSSSANQVVGPLLNDPRARKLSFTGSTEVGKMLVEQSATQLLRVSMELGGNAAFIILDDADLDLAVEGAVRAKMRNGGSPAPLRTGSSSTRSAAMNSPGVSPTEWAGWWSGMAWRTARKSGR